MNCLKCGGTGKYEDKLTGIEVVCECQLEIQKEDVKTKGIEFLKKMHEREENKEMLVEFTGGENMSAYASGAVPEHRKDDCFSVEYFKECVRARYKVDSKPVVGMTKYINTLSNIFLDVQAGKRIGNSYIISACNGFGKTTFANTVIKELHRQGKKVVPYLPLMEIYNLMMAETLLTRLGKSQILTNKDRDTYIFEPENDKKIKYYLKETKDNEGAVNDTLVVGNYAIECFVKQYANFEYSYLDFIGAEILFTSLSEPFLHEYEMPILAYLLKERSRLGKPTIVFCDEALKSYICDGKSKDYIDNFVANTAYDKRCLDKLIYIACYRDVKGGENFEV